MDRSVNPEMLILARESRGLTQGEIATATSISQGNISKYESGMLNVSEEHLHRIALKLQYPENFFFLVDKIFSFGSSCTYHRKRQTMPTKELKTILAKVNVLRINIGKLLEGVEIENDNLFQRLDVDDFDGDVEQIARLVRKGWKLPSGPVVNLVRAIENAGGVAHLLPFGTRKLDAISQWIPSVRLDMPPLFVINSEMPGDRTRYTLAHELGHLIMHRVPTINMEEEADRFAAEFLMPANDISIDLRSVTLSDLVRLKAYWKVSIAALARRAYDLEKITARQYKSLNEQLSKQGYRINEPYSLPVEEPTVIKDIIDVYQKENLYSISELSDLVLLYEKETKEKFINNNRKLRIVS